MEQASPLDDFLFVLKDGNRIGPLTVDEVLEMIDEGTLDYEDLCLREGAGECERLRDVLDWEPEDDAAEVEVAETENEPPGEEAANSDSESRPVPPGAVLYRGHPSVVNYPFAFFFLLTGITAGLFLYPVSVWITLSGFAVSLLALCRLAYQRTICLHLVTPRRIEIVTGFLAKSSNEIRIVDIRAINVTLSGIKGLLGVGTLEFFTSGDEPEITFANIWSARQVKKLVRDIQDSDT